MLARSGTLRELIWTIHYRFENCRPTASRRQGRPYFLRSFMRASRVRNPESRIFLIMPVADIDGIGRCRGSGRNRHAAGNQCRAADGPGSMNDRCWANRDRFGLLAGLLLVLVALDDGRIAKGFRLLLALRTEHGLERASHTLAHGSRLVR